MFECPSNGALGKWVRCLFLGFPSGQLGSKLESTVWNHQTDLVALWWAAHFSSAAGSAPTLHHLLLRDLDLVTPSRSTWRLLNLSITGTTPASELPFLPLWATSLMWPKVAAAVDVGSPLGSLRSVQEHERKKTIQIRAADQSSGKGWMFITQCGKIIGFSTHTSNST